jgi:hypothetical protein
LRKEAYHEIIGLFSEDAKAMASAQELRAGSAPTTQNPVRPSMPGSAGLDLSDRRLCRAEPFATPARPAIAILAKRNAPFYSRSINALRAGMRGSRLRGRINLLRAHPATVPDRAPRRRHAPSGIRPGAPDKSLFGRKIPCSGNQNSLFGFVREFAGKAAKSFGNFARRFAEMGSNSKNTLIISLFSGKSPLATCELATFELATAPYALKQSELEGAAGCYLGAGGGAIRHDEPQNRKS